MAVCYIETVQVNRNSQQERDKKTRAVADEDIPRVRRGCGREIRLDHANAEGDDAECNAQGEHPSSPIKTSEHDKPGDQDIAADLVGNCPQRHIDRMIRVCTKNSRQREADKSRYIAEVAPESVA